MHPVRSARPVSGGRVDTRPPRPRTPPLGPPPQWEYHRLFLEPRYTDPLIRWEIEQEAQDYDETPPRRGGPRRQQRF